MSDKLPTAEEYYFSVANFEKLSPELCFKMMKDYSKLVLIDGLKQHIEHPTKPGYKRYDILDKIAKLEKK